MPPSLPPGSILSGDIGGRVTKASKLALSDKIYEAARSLDLFASIFVVYYSSIRHPLDHNSSAIRVVSRLKLDI